MRRLRRSLIGSGPWAARLTADPGELVERSPLVEFALPGSFTDVSVIIRYALEQVQAVIGAYGEFLELVRGRDELSYQLVLRLLADEVHREADIEAALQNQDESGGPG